MDILSAFSGLERIAIIGGAMLVGYWGYRLFATDRTPALIFMGVACAVLFGALFTGGSHVKNIGASYQLATASADAPAQAEVPEVAPVAQAAATQLPPSKSDDDADPDPIAIIDEPVAEAPDSAPAPGETSNGSSVEQVAATSQALESARASVDKQDLLSSQELGGRIVSVKSGSITLEWSPRDG